MTSVKKEERREDRKFVALPPETVQLVAETSGLSNLQPTVAAALSEDASYRARELAHICSQLMRHSKRKRLVSSDLSRALRLFDAQPIYGHDATATPASNAGYIPVPEAEVYVEDDEDCVDLAELALGHSDIANNDGGGLSLQANWLGIEGKAAEEGGRRTFDDFPHQGNLSPALIQYFSSGTNAILSDSDELAKIILEDIASNPKISPLVPFFVSFIRTGIQKYCGNKILLSRLLHLLEALFLNKYLNLYPKPYLSHLVTAILSSLKTDRGRPLQLSHQNGHHGRGIYNDTVAGEDLYDETKIEHVPMAANILRYALDRWSTPVNLLRGQTLKALVVQFNDAGLSFVSHYGALRALIALGPRVIEEQVLPHLDRYLAYLDSKPRLNVGRGFGGSQHASKINSLMRGTLVEAARIVARHHYQNPAQDPILESRRNMTYSWLYSHFGDALVTVFTNRTVNGGGGRIPSSNRDDLGKLKIRAIGKVSVGNGRSGTPVKSTYSSIAANRLQAETSLPFDIFEPMDTSSSPEKFLTAGSDAGPRRLSEMSCAAFEPISAYTVIPIRARNIGIVAPGFVQRSRAHLKRRAFQQMVARSHDTKRAKTLPGLVVVGKRSGDMLELKKRRKRIDMKPRSLLSLF